MVEFVFSVVGLAANFDLVIGVVTEPLFVLAVQSSESSFSSLVLTFSQINSHTSEDILLIGATNVNFAFHLTFVSFFGGPFDTGLDVLTVFIFANNSFTLLQLTPVEINVEFTAAEIGGLDAGVNFNFSFGTGLVIESGVSVDFPVVFQDWEGGQK